MQTASADSKSQQRTAKDQVSSMMFYNIYIIYTLYIYMYIYICIFTPSVCIITCGQGNAEQRLLSSADQVSSSDHKPVYAHFAATSEPESSSLARLCQAKGIIRFLTGIPKTIGSILKCWMIWGVPLF